MYKLHIFFPYFVKGYKLSLLIFANIVMISWSHGKTLLVRENSCKLNNNGHPEVCTMFKCYKFKICTLSD